MAEQLVLGLRSAVPQDRAHFEVGEANRAALAWIDRWPDWPMRGLALVGPPGAGKSHLARIWAASSGAEEFLGAELALHDFERVAEPWHVLIEGADRATAEPLLHLLNFVRERGGSVLMTSERPPTRWDVELADLSSRLAALPVAEIQPPDDQLLRRLFERLLADQGIAIGGDAVSYLMVRIERSYAAVHRLAEELDRRSLQHGRLTIPAIRDLVTAP